MSLCPRCTAFVLINKSEHREEWVCNKCGWWGVIWLENGKKFGQQQKVNQEPKA